MAKPKVFTWISISVLMALSKSILPETTPLTFLNVPSELNFTDSSVGRVHFQHNQEHWLLPRLGSLRRLICQLGWWLNFAVQRNRVQ